jgi:hypothetical protein
MTDTQAETHVNGSAPPAADPAAGECADCVSGGEKALAVVAFLFGVFVLLIAVDMFSGGKVTGLVREAQAQARE